MRRKGTVVILDPKGDRGLLARAAAEAERYGKPFALVSTAAVDYSASFNPLASAQDPLEIADRIAALTPNSREPFFESFSMAFITALASAQQQLGIPWTLKGLYEASVIRVHMLRLIDQYLIHLGCYRPGNDVEARMVEYEKQGLKDHTADALINFARWPRDHYQKVTGTLVPTFHGVVEGPLGALLSPEIPDLTWQTIIDQGMVVYIALASMLLGETANRIGRTILQDLVGFLGRRYAYDDPATMSPITVIVDEFGDVVYPEFINALNKARGANVRFCLAMQSRADAEAKLGQDHARRVFENLGVTCLFRLADMKTAETAFKGLTSRVELPQPPMVGLGYGGVGGLTGHAQGGLKAYEVPTVRPGLLTALPVGEGFMLKGGVLWKFRVPLIEPVPDETLERLGLASMWRALAP